MNKRVETLIEDVRKLTPEERAELFDRLNIEFDDEVGSDDTPEEIEAAWVEEIERRIDEVERGDVSLIPHDQVMAELRARLRRP